MDYKSYIAEKLNIKEIDKKEILSFIEVPPNKDMGDFALPCFKLSKILRASPVKIAEDLKNNFETDQVISSISAVNGYLNFKINRDGFALSTLSEILEKKEDYGKDNLGNGKTICIDYSSINIAKPFHIGHLSTTVIGSALCKIFRFLGYKVVGINHLGDYGTQFGKLIVAYKLWSSEQQVKEGRLKELTRIYVMFHEQAKLHPELEDQARHYFKLIEDGDKESNNLFNLFKKITLEEVDKIYKLLNVTFDSYAGESFYNDKMQPIVEELEHKGLLQESEGASIVNLDEYDMPPCLILKSDGSSLYATRDIAAAVYRKNTYDFYKNLYVVAYQQNLHFKQFFKVLELMGKDWAKDCVHIAYGMVSLESGSMSTRQGKVVLLEDVINKTIEKAYKVIEEKNPNLKDKEKTAKAVGTGAVIFGALCNNKIKDIDVDKNIPCVCAREEKSSSSTLDNLETNLNNFLEEFGIMLDSYTSIISEIDFELLTERFRESEWLKANISSFKKVCEYYPKIISGYYKDYNKKPREDNSWNTLKAMFKEAKAEEEKEEQGGTT